MTAYYNEIDKFAAQWLRELIKEGQIAPGYVDERSIEDVKPEELRNYTQCHFFAGIGVWSYALRKAGWPDNRPVWTGSCPCQPFSAAGKGNGFADERHLWPAFFHLIEQCKPSMVFGEQVASKDGLAWIDLVQSDMEAANYAFGAVDTCAAGFGAPHIRQRLYWVGKGMADATINRRRLGREQNTSRPKAKRVGSSNESSCNSVTLRRGTANGFWGGSDWVFCDDAWRNCEPRSFPLVDGASAKVGRLRGYGNAINAEQATGFIEAVLSY